MRPIKFRCYTSSDLENYKMVYSDEYTSLLEYATMNGLDGNHMQFTGLYDKDYKNEIYDGDILLIESYKFTLKGLDIGQVFYQTSKARFFLKCVKSNADFGISNKLSQVNKFSRVIGNIHETPELLESKK